MNSESLFFLRSSCSSRALSRDAVISFSSVTLSSHAACWKGVISVFNEEMWDQIDENKEG